MFRVKVKDLEAWKSKKDRKPLILNGARQVGKSWLINQFGLDQFDGNILVVNFEKSKDIHSIFHTNYDVKRIILELELVLNAQIRVGEVLLFFDEIQACPNALTSLRYFYEELPELHIVAAGSLLDFEFRNQSFPVGRVEIMDLHPMTFYEFLLARGKQTLANILLETPIILSETIDRLLKDELNYYFVVGGMPECVNSFIEWNDLQKVNAIQDNLLYAYSQDFKKYQPVVNSECLTEILEVSSKSIGNQIIYTKLSNRFTGPTLKKGVDVLQTARILHVVRNGSISGLPISVSTKQFKIYHLDIGLLLRLRKLSFQEYFINKNLTTAFEGSLSEQFVAQQLITSQKDPLYYWARTAPGSTAEVDFIIIRESQIIPVEVKAGKSGSLKSLHLLLKEQPNIEKAIVYSHAKFGTQDNINYIPIYFAGQYS